MVGSMSRQPSAAFRRHHDVEAPAVDARSFRQGWRVASRLDALHRDGRITAGQWQAAVEFRAAWERVLRVTGGTPELGTRVSGSAGGAGVDRLAAVADTITKLREIEAAIGRLAFDLCLACVVEDAAWVTLGKLLHRDRETARDYAAAAIRLLAPAWEAATRRRRPPADTQRRPAARRPVERC